MLNINGNEIWRGNVKIGWVDGHRLYDSHGKEVATWNSECLFDGGGELVLKVEGDSLVGRNGGIMGRLEDTLEAVPAANFNDMTRVAIKTFLGN